MDRSIYALISVFDKKNLFQICEALCSLNIKIISTGSTSKKIKDLGFKCKTVSDFTKFPEILEGRVKTLHPKIHASILYNREKKDQRLTFKKINFPRIEFVIVNLYPFDKINKQKADKSHIIEMIDIGGATLLRSAAKNFNSITAISDISDYNKFIKNINNNKGLTSLRFRKEMAQKVFSTMSDYDLNISNWLKKKEATKKITLKYGENPNQKSFFYLEDSKNSIFKNQISGKRLGYNNILDFDSGMNCIEEFTEPTCVIIKHNNPCGVASGKTIKQAFEKAFQCDPISAFGGIVILNRNINYELSKLLSEKFFEIVGAKNFNKKSILTLQNSKKLILIKTSKLKLNRNYEIKKVIGGFLSQEKNNQKITKKDLTCVSYSKKSKKIIEDLIFAFKVCKHVKSNAIVLVKKKQTIGIGAGQMSRIDSTNLALLKKENNFKNSNFVAASDAFFPFTDNRKILSKNNCDAIIQPSGLINDKKIIKFADDKKLGLYFTKYRLFKH